MRYQVKTHQDAGVICDINTTPMIDVLLVLIVMLIITLPAQNHKIAVDLPTSLASDAPPPPVHRLAITSTGSYLWDGAALTAASLPITLKAHVADPLAPVLELQTDPAAPYVTFDETLAVVKRAGVTKIGFVGNAPSF
jgi:biopolymer transport protein ExbD